MPSASEPSRTPRHAPAVDRGSCSAGRPSACCSLAAARLAFPSMAPDPTSSPWACVIAELRGASRPRGTSSAASPATSRSATRRTPGSAPTRTALLIIDGGIDPWVALVARRGVVVAVLAVPIGIAALRVRGASFVIVSIALVLILLLVSRAGARVTGGSRRPAGAAPVRRGRAPARAARAVLLPARRPARRGAAGVVADRPVPLRHRPQGDPRGRGQGPVARRADVQVQARGRSSSRRSSPRSPAGCTRCGSATSTRSSSSRSWSAPTWC